MQAAGYVSQIPRPKRQNASHNSHSRSNWASASQASVLSLKGRSVDPGGNRYILAHLALGREFQR